MSRIPHRRFEVFAGHPVKAVVTTRAGGVSTGPYESLNLGLHVGDDPAAVVENRRRAAAALDLALEDLVFCEQSHGPNVVVVDDAHRGRGTVEQSTALSATDALVTDTPGLGLVVMVADCVPLVLFDPVTRTLATVHAGWGGTVSRITSATVDALRGRGVDPADLLVGIGPAIPPERYEVGEDVAERARAGLGPIVDDVLTPRSAPGKYSFDLWASNRRLLLEAGVRPDHIEVMAEPTGADGPFFSHRAANPCGRFAALATLTG